MDRGGGDSVDADVDSDGIGVVEVLLDRVVGRGVKETVRQVVSDVVSHP